ncbi:MAG: AAA family ATPase [Bacillota bacterium]
MLKELRIKNFQSHQDTVLELDSGLNMIAGPSDSGKSAIIRALRWVLYNEPLGDDFIRMGSRKCQVGILLENDYRIIRERSSSENRYLIIDPDGHQEVYTGFGTKVPAEVSELHQMSKVALDNELESSLNLDFQLSGPFLLDDSGSTKAKAIGQLTGVHIIDAAIKDVARDLRRTKDQISQESTEIERINEKLMDYQELPQLKEEIKRKEELVAQIKSVQNQLEEYRTWQNKWQKLKEEESELKAALAQLDSLDEVAKLSHQLEMKDACLSKLIELSSDWQQVNTTIEQLANYLQQLENLEQVEAAYQKLETNSKQRTELMTIKEELTTVNQQIKVKEEVLQHLQKLARVEEILSDGDQLVEQYDTLLEINQQLTKVRSELQQKEKQLAQLPVIKQVQQIINNLEESQQRLSKLKSISDELKEITQSWQRGQECIKELEEELETKLEQYRTKLKEQKRCPVCFSELERDRLDEIISNYQLEGIDDE